jgi:site-specific recombinase XerD
MTHDLLTQFADYQRGKGLMPRTIANRDYMLRALERGTETRLERINIHDLRAWMGRGISKTSMQTERNCFQAFFRFLVEDELRTDDPTERLAKIRAPRARPRPFTLDQIDGMLHSGAYRKTRAMILLARYQGFRASEVAAAHGDDFDLESGLLQVMGKGGKRSVLPLHPVIAELALTMPRDSWWFPARKSNDGHIHSKSVSDLMRKAKNRTGIKNERLTGHSLRHSYGTDLVRAGVDLRTVQELMRHESLATTQIYTLIDDEQMRAGLTLLPGSVIPEHSGRKAA